MHNPSPASFHRFRQTLLPVLLLAMSCCPAFAGGDYERLASAISAACSKAWEAAMPTSACIMEADAKYGKSLEYYYEVVVQPGDAKAQKIRESQRAWLKFQETSCDLEAQRSKADGPSFLSLTRANCLLLTTLKRIDELKALAEPSQ